ncbi:2'-5' RNA ligase family protein [Pantanalinema sp. GBBB05]|uniref:2'-5' RNA ligase family protein n=1 Tax=Pantanalinema sp. GBBB05 TaxID=2604139 RepID=UPI001D85DBBF|nr:2'-5' RNA ligase family protein [Pantanalinema sp. GBBB05]
MTTAPLILTLKLDQESFDRFNALRQQYFPPERNLLSAHVTLFHALPGEQIFSIQETLKSVCSQTAPLPLYFPQLRFLGRGVAIEVDCPQLVQARQQLAKGWQPWLTPQDRQGYRPHLTIQNKVTATVARQFYEQLSRTWQASHGWGEGLLLWHYQGGPWQLAAEFLFNSTVL